MNTDLQDIIAQSSIRAYNAGFEAGKKHVLKAVDFVLFEHNNVQVAAKSDINDELELRSRNDTAHVAG